MLLHEAWPKLPSLHIDVIKINCLQSGAPSVLMVACISVRGKNRFVFERERERDLVSQTVWTVLCPVKIISRVCRADCQQKKYQNKNLMTNLRDGQTDIAQ